MSTTKGLLLRGTVWWYCITLKGRRHRGSCLTSDRKQAQEFYDKKRAALWDADVNCRKVRRTWQETVSRWLSEHEHKKSFKDDVAHAAFWGGVFSSLKITFLDQITPDIIKGIIDRELGRAHKRTARRRLMPATANRKVMFLRTVINAAHKHYMWLDVRPGFRLLREDNARDRWITRAEYDRLEAALPEPYNMMARLAVSTGLRQSNVLGLRWSDVDMQRRQLILSGRVMKNGKTHSIPLSEAAMSAIRSQLGRSDQYVFVRPCGNRFNGVMTRLWGRACQQAGLEDFKWHDLRHTWATWMIMYEKVSLLGIKRLGGWMSDKMVERYAHMDIDYLRVDAEAIDRVLAVTKPTLTQICHSES